MDSYEEKYKKALSRIQGLYKGLHGKTKEEAEEAFPELAESEDERIRKALIHLVNSNKELSFGIDNYDGIKWSDILAWLEKHGEQETDEWKEGNIIRHGGILALVVKGRRAMKSNGELFTVQYPKEWVKAVPNEIECFLNELEKQGEQNLANSAKTCKDEQKPTDKVEPKFHEGDWVTNGDYTWKIVVVKPLDYILQSQDGNMVDDTISHVDEQFHLWTIQDAKDGDVLCSGQIILLFKKWEEDNDWNFVIAYAGIDISGKLQITNGHWLISNSTQPATKEQCDLLFQKMKEARYEWNAEKKELKKIKEEYNGEDYGIDGLYAAVDILQKTLGKVDGYQTDDGILEHKCAISAVKQLYEQKPAAWSEEDESLCMQIEGLLNVCRTKSLLSFDLYKKMCDLLKSLKDRVQPQPKQEWSEEDKCMLNNVIDTLKPLSQTTHSGYAINSMINWLKSLKPQSRQEWSVEDDKKLIERLKSLRPQTHWKPSDEQMDALHYVTNFDYGGHKATLVSLYEQLKKLREE